MQTQMGIPAFSHPPVWFVCDNVQLLQSACLSSGFTDKYAEFVAGSGEEYTSCARVKLNQPAVPHHECSSDAWFPTIQGPLCAIRTKSYYEFMFTNFDHIITPI